MKRYFYSPSTAGFYVDGIHGDSIPADAREVDEDRYWALVEGQVDGMEIRPNAQGDPELVQAFAPSTVPPEVSRFQARAALLQSGLLESVEAYMADAGTDPFVRVAWQDAQVFKRRSPTIQALQPLLGLTDAQLDDLFRFASTIEA